MTSPLLSVLIPTVIGREDELKKLRDNLFPQALAKGKIIAGMPEPKDGIKYFMWHNDVVEIMECEDNKEITIGEKRELMYQKATGLYSIMVDDDDLLSDDAIDEILDAIQYDPDCITFEEFIDIDGKIEKSNHRLTYGDWEGEGGKELWDGFHYHRTPFFKSVIKTEIARSVPIPHIRFGEDHQWAQALKFRLKTEIHIDKQLYKYIHRSSNFNERYGFDRANNT